MTFIWIFSAGMMVGLVFDFYRSLRRFQGWGQALTLLGDILFSFAALVILFCMFEKANSLAFRFYVIWVSLLGLILYLRLLSRFSLRIYFRFYKIISFLAGLICRGIKIPIKVLALIMGPPYAILRWFSMLLYRMSEFLWLELSRNFKKKVIGWWNSLIPPRIK